MSETERKFASCEDVRASIYRSLGEYVLKAEAIKYYWRAESERKISEALGLSKLVSEAVDEIIEGKDPALHGSYFRPSIVDFAVDPSKRNSDFHFDAALTRLLDEIPTIEKDDSDPESVSWKLYRQTKDPATYMVALVDRTTEPAQYPQDESVFERVHYRLAFGIENAQNE